MTLTILSTNVAGVIHAGPDFEQINFGDEVHLFAEPDNQFDRDAIRVQHQDAGKLGYVPAISTVCIRDAVAAGLTPLARIESFEAEGRYPKIHLVVTVDV